MLFNCRLAESAPGVLPTIFELRGQMKGSPNQAMKPIGCAGD